MTTQPNPKPLSAQERAHIRFMCGIPEAVAEGNEGTPDRILARYCNRALDDLERARELLRRLVDNEFDRSLSGQTDDDLWWEVEAYLASAEEGK